MGLGQVPTFYHSEGPKKRSNSLKATPPKAGRGVADTKLNMHHKRYPGSALAQNTASLTKDIPYSSIPVAKVDAQVGQLELDLSSPRVLEH